MPDWTHTDIELGARVARGERRARDGDWETGTLNDRLADLRAYLLSNASAQAALIGGTTSGAERATLDLRPGKNLPPERVRAAEALRATWDVLAEGNVYPDQALGTVALGAPSAETGALPAGVVVVVVLGLTAAACWVAWQGADVIDRQLSRLTRARELLQADETLKHIVDQHAADEKTAGKALPLSPAAAAAVDLLRERQAELSKELPRSQAGDSISGLVKWGLVAAAAILLGRELLASR